LIILAGSVERNNPVVKKTWEKMATIDVSVLSDTTYEKMVTAKKRADNPPAPPHAAGVPAAHVSQQILAIFSCQVPAIELTIVHPADNLSAFANSAR